MDATVWAYREGNFAGNTNSGWSHCIEFGKEDSIKEIEDDGRRGRVDRGTLSLLDKLEKAGLRGRIERLAIVAHGAPGKVFMSGLTGKLDSAGNAIGRAPASPENLRDLSTYLQKEGMLIFASCNAGLGLDGSKFIMSLSKELPERVIVAYTIANSFSPWSSSPGEVNEAPNNALERGTPTMSAWGIYAKWAYKGKIVRIPYDEMNAFNRSSCANPHCPHHDYRDRPNKPKRLDRCPYEKWGHGAVLKRYNP